MFKSYYFVLLTSFCFLCILSLSFSKVSAQDLTSIRNINLLDILAYVDNGVMKIAFLYKNRETDKSVYWREGQLTVDCQIYEKIGDRLRDKGSRIGFKNQRVTSFSQDIYWDVPKSLLDRGKRAVVECSTHTGVLRLTAVDDVRLDNR